MRCRLLAVGWMVGCARGVAQGPDTDTDSADTSDSSLETGDSGDSGDTGDECLGTLQVTVSVDPEVSCLVGGDCVGDLHVGVYASDPFPDPGIPSVAGGHVSADLSGGGVVELTIVQVPCGLRYLSSMLDDNATANPDQPSPDTGDLVTTSATTVEVTDQGVIPVTVVLDLRAVD